MQRENWLLTYMVNNMTNSGSARKTRIELLSEWRHQEVLEAARSIFAGLGYAATTVEEIAKEAGMAKGTIYLYFKSKEEVYAAVLASDLDYLTKQMIEGMSAAKTFDERLTVFLNQRLVHIKNNRDFVRIYCAESESRGSRSALTSKAIDKPFLRGVVFMRQCLEEAIADGELRSIPVEPAAFTIFALARGFFERHLRGWTHLTLEEDVAFTHSLIMNGLRK
jgi:AcrR family transcriptional regulator